MIIKFDYRSPGQGRQKNNSKNKNRNFEEIIFSILFFLHGEKENFEEYSIFLESAELSFAILINYSARKWRTCPQTTVSLFLTKSTILNYNNINNYKNNYINFILMNKKLKNSQSIIPMVL
jgi:hypothetical protein